MRLIAAAIALSALAFAAGCDAGDDNAALTATPDVTADAAQPTVAATTGAILCPGPGMQRQSGTHTLTHAGLERTYMLYLPAGYDGRGALPLVVNLHGRGSNAGEQAAYSRLAAAADEHGFIVATPDGTGEGGELAWALLPGGVDDIGFITALLDELQQELCVDGDRIYAAGISNGSALAQQLACALPGRIAGVVAVAAAVYPSLRCRGVDAPVAIVAFHGTVDAFVPYDGGTAIGGLPVLPVPDVIALWARHNGCDETPAEQRYSAHVRLTMYSACNEDVPVMLFTVEDGGHTWPGSPDVPRLGPTTHEVDATEIAARLITGRPLLPAAE